MLHSGDVVREFVNREVVPNIDRWEEDRSTGRDVWSRRR